MDRPERRWCRRVLRDTQDRSTCSAASATTSYEHQMATTQPRARRSSTLSTLDNATTASTPSRSRPSAAWTRRPRRPEQPAVSRSRFPFGLLLCMGQRASEPGPRSRSLGTSTGHLGVRSRDARLLRESSRLAVLGRRARASSGPGVWATVQVALANRAKRQRPVLPLGA